MGESECNRGNITPVLFCTCNRNGSAFHCIMKCMEIRDFGVVHGVAVPKVDDEVRSADSSKPDSGAFANPNVNVREMALRPGMKVADFGAGSGAYALAMARIVGESGRVYAVDVQKDMLLKIKNEARAEGLGNVDIIWGDMDRKGGTKVADRALDMVLLSNTLFQLEEKQTAFEEAKRTLKPDGTLVVIDWQESYGGMGPRSEDVVSIEKARVLANAAGFSPVREFPAGLHHYGIVFRRLSGPSSHGDGDN